MATVKRFEDMEASQIKGQMFKESKILNEPPTQKKTNL
jgi:hypothetical protein